MLTDTMKLLTDWTDYKEFVTHCFANNIDFDLSKSHYMDAVEHMQEQMKAGMSMDEAYLDFIDSRRDPERLKAHMLKKHEQGYDANKPCGTCGGGTVR